MFFCDIQKTPRDGKEATGCTFFKDFLYSAVLKVIWEKAVMTCTLNFT